MGDPQVIMGFNPKMRNGPMTGMIRAPVTWETSKSQVLAGQNCRILRHSKPPGFSTLMYG